MTDLGSMDMTVSLIIVLVLILKLLSEIFVENLKIGN